MYPEDPKRRSPAKRLILLYRAMSGRKGVIGVASLKSTIYGRLEETSFRSGAAVSAGVLAAVGVGITLAVVLGGHSDAVAGLTGPAAAARTVVPPGPAVTAAPSVTPRASGTSPAGGQPAVAPSPATAASRNAPGQGNQGAPGATPTPRTSHSPWYPPHGLAPGGWNPSTQPDPWPWGWLRRAARDPRTRQVPGRAGGRASITSCVLGPFGLICSGAG